MAQYECSRCTREWFVEFQKGQEPAEPANLRLAMEVPLAGEDSSELVEVDFDELCSSCVSTVRNLVANIAKTLEKSSPDRAKKEAPTEGAHDEVLELATQPAALSSSQTSSEGTPSEKSRATR